MDLSRLGEPDIQVAALRLWVHGRQSEDAQDYWDGNWLRVTAHCAEGGGSVRADGSFLHLGEVAGFFAECERLLEALQGVAKLLCIEPNLGVELSASNSLGDIAAEIHLTPDHLTQQHSFRFAIDQSYLPRIISGLRKVLAAFPVRGEPGK